jgi:hypothetical protein
MTGCDLCASIKPWHVQCETVKVIFEEFYAQVQKSYYVILNVVDHISGKDTIVQCFDVVVLMLHVFTVIRGFFSSGVSSYNDVLSVVAH